MQNPHPIEITNLQQLFLSKETKEAISDINNGEYKETEQHDGNAGFLRGGFYTANEVTGKNGKKYIHRVKGGTNNQNDYDANKNYQQALASAMNSAFMNAIGVRSHYVIYDNYLEHCGKPYCLKLSENIQKDNNFFLHTFLAFLIYGFLDRTMKNVCINDNKEFINIDLDDDNFSWYNSFPSGKNATLENEMSTLCSQFGKLNFLPNDNNIIGNEASNNINKTINEMVNFNLDNVVKALIDEAVKFYKKDNNYQNMLLALKTTIDTYVRNVGNKLYLLSRGTFHQYFYNKYGYGNQHPLLHLMLQIANHEKGIEAKANQLLSFNLSINLLDEYLTDKFKENINNNSLTQEQLSTIIRNNSFSMPEDSKLMQEINSTLQKNSPEQLFGDVKYNEQQDIQADYNEKEFETKNFCEKCLNNISNCFGLC